MYFPVARTKFLGFDTPNHEILHAVCAGIEFFLRFVMFSSANIK